jgi:transcriptional regulator with XRE-family HTH domain
MSTPPDSLGNKIRSTRRQLKLTLNDVARMTGLTESLISQIENSKANPSITTLMAISRALNTPVGVFFDLASQADSPVLRQQERTLANTSNGIRYYMLTPNLKEQPFEVLYNEFDPGASTGPRITHSGIEFGMVLEGKLEVTVEDTIYVLNSGDTITLDSSKPHMLHNISDKVTTALWVDSPASF